MVFLIWFFWWMSLATTPLQLVIPAIALVVRFSYVQRRFPQFPSIVVLFWVFLALYTAAFQGVVPGLVLLSKLFLTTVCVFHFWSRLRSSRLLRGRVFGKAWFFLSRALVVWSGRMHDIRHWLTVRARSIGGWRPKAYLQLGAPMSLTFLLEGVSLTKRVGAVVESRGGFPDSMEWIQSIESQSGWVYVLVGDILILATSIITLWMEGDDLIPGAIMAQMIDLFPRLLQ